MSEQDVAFVQIATDGSPIDTWEFSYFLYLFSAAYTAALHEVFQRGIGPYESVERINQFANDARSWLPDRGFGIAQLARQAPTIVDIRRENPLEIVFGGVAVALAVAMIISGGEFKGLGVKVKLPPLGDGISKLREAFGRPPVKAPRKSKPRKPRP